jgi:hypothetical protein
MNKEEFEKYLEDRYIPQVNWYDRKAIWNHKSYQALQWISLILASLTPVLILTGQDWSKWLAAAIALLAAISVGSLKIFKYQENWINYRTTCETLRKEIYYYRAGVQGYDATNDKEALFVDRVESLISRENTLWVITHEKEEHQNKK